MRVIAGKARRTQLKTVEGLSTRPTTDRIKETLFNMLQNQLYDTRFLDLYAGSGAIGIEALSRGALSAHFVENNKEAIDCIKANLKACHFIEQSNIMQMDCLEAIRNLNRRGYVFDVVFMDPPYGAQHEKRVLAELSTANIITEDTLVIIEANLDTDFSYLAEYGFNLVKEKCYKTNKHVFVSKNSRSTY